MERFSIKIKKKITKDINKIAAKRAWIKSPIGWLEAYDRSIENIIKININEEKSKKLTATKKIKISNKLKKTQNKRK